MKNLSKTWVRRACNICIALGGLLYFPKMSALFFGETEYPSKPEE